MVTRLGLKTVYNRDHQGRFRVGRIAASLIFGPNGNWEAQISGHIDRIARTNGSDFDGICGSVDDGREGRYSSSNLLDADSER